MDGQEKWKRGQGHGESVSRSQKPGRETQVNDHIGGGLEPIKSQMLTNTQCALPDQAIRRNQSRNYQVPVFKEKVINLTYINVQKYTENLLKQTDARRL